MSVLILASPEDRVKLLRAGLTGMQIEKVFVILNHLETVGMVLYIHDAEPSNE